MRFTIFTHVDHCYENRRYFGYAPYVREMNIWCQHFSDVEVVAPLTARKSGKIDLPYQCQVTFTKLPLFDITTAANSIKTLLLLPLLSVRIISAMHRSDHIHLRCPGNIGLLACIFQIFFKKKPKTAKYAGNWDPKSKQPASYRLQKWILNNRFLTRNMKVLVYGDWPGTSENIVPFFTATYAEADKKLVVPRELSTPLKFMFAGALSDGKQPLYALKMVEWLTQSGVDATIKFFGEGPQRSALESYIANHNLKSVAVLAGNQEEIIMRSAYQENHFLILASKSEGWPKVIAEAMFWGCVPVGTKVSCVPHMLDHGNRGILLTLDLERDVAQLLAVCKDPSKYSRMAIASAEWSRGYTTDEFENEIKKLLL